MVSSLRRLPGAGLLTAMLVVLACDKVAPRASREGAAIGLCERQPHLEADSYSDAVLVRRFGDADGITFGEIKAVVVDAEGNLFVADGVARNVTMISSDGRAIGQFGRSGSGPGEFLYPVTLAMTAHDTIAVFDAQRWIISYYGTDGSYGRQEHLPAMAGFGQDATITIEPDGRIFALTYTNFQRTIEESLGRRRKGIGQGVIGIAELDRQRGRWNERFSVRGQEVFVDREEGSLRDIWFGAKAQLAGAGGMIWTGDGRSGDIVMFTVATGRSCRGRLPGYPHTVSQAERDSFYFAKDLIWRGTDRVTRARARRRNVELPHAKAYISQLIADEQSVWVRTPSPEPDRDRWILIDATMAVRRVLHLPSSVTLLFARGDRLYGRRHTPEGVPVLEEYSIVDVPVAQTAVPTSHPQ